MSTEELIGEVTHYFSHVNAAVVKLIRELSQGQTIHIKGHTTDVTLQTTSMQLDHKAITSAKAGEDVGLQVTDRVRVGDKVYLVTS